MRSRNALRPFGLNRTMELPVPFIGWFYALGCGVVVAIGTAIFGFLYASGRLKVRYDQYSVWNDVLLLALWLIGLIGGIGVIETREWSRWVLELFCWALVALTLLSSGTRIYQLLKMGDQVPMRDFVVATISVICMAVPIVVFCAATVITLRSSAAANTLAG